MKTINGVKVPDAEVKQLAREGHAAAIAALEGGTDDKTKASKADNETKG